MNRIQFWLANAALLLVFIVPLLVLYGWTINNPVLTRVFPQFTPMNPVTAICFVLVAVSLILARFGFTRLCHFFFVATGTVLVVVGTLMLVKYLVGYDLFVDRVFFESKLGINRMAVTTSFCFLLLGLCFIVYPRFRQITRVVKLSIALIASYAFVAYLYNFVGVYGKTVLNPMAFHTAILFLVISIYSLIHEGLWDGEVMAFLRKKNLLISVTVLSLFGVMMVLVCGTWYLLDSNVREQSALKFESQSDQITSFVSSRMNLYTDPIYGLQGLFAASQSVESSEWDAYVQRLDVPRIYSGISSIGYAQKISKKDIKGLPFTIYPKTEKDTYFPLTYISSFVATTSAGAGFDYSSDPVRNSALTKAIETNLPIATPVVLGVTNKIPLFSIYAPIYKTNKVLDSAAERKIDTKGIISISFRIEKIFPDLTSNPLFDRNINVQIFDSEPQALTDDKVLYDSQNQDILKSNPDLVKTTTIMVGQRTWTLKFLSLSKINLPAVERYAPNILFGIGFLFSIFVTFFVFLYIRSHEKALKSKALQLESLVNSFPYGVVIEDGDRNVLIQNELAKQMLGAKQMVKDVAEYEKRIAEVVKSQKRIVDEKVELLNGKFMARSYVPFNENTANGAIWIYKDITEEQKIDQMKTEFVSLASHQLRTPLTSIKWYAELLLDKSAGALNVEQEGYVKEVETATARMVELVNSLLNVSRLELGTFAIEPEAADIITIVSEAVHEQEPTFVEKKQTFTFTHPDSLVPINLDKKITHIIVQNLLSNAHKYTPEGGTIKLSIQKLESGAGGGSIQVICSDNGFGIPAAQQGSVFSKLFRADNIRTLDVEGTGLGLYIIKTVVDAAGCTISFTSEEKKGTTFILTIPLSGMLRKDGSRPLSVDDAKK